jgi:hypothetical protein
VKGENSGWCLRSGAAKGWDAWLGMCAWLVIGDWEEQAAGEGDTQSPLLMMKRTKSNVSTGWRE